MDEIESRVIVILIGGGALLALLQAVFGKLIELGYLPSASALLGA